VADDLFRVAVAQASPVFLDRSASLDKAVRLIGAAAEQDAVLVVFGEAWLPGYPIHALASASSDLWWEFAAEYLDQAIDFSGPEIDALASAASDADIDVVIGLAERDSATQGSIYSTLAFIGRDGQVIDRHRKLRPNPCERAVWADGEAASLRVYERGYANLSGLISTEHQMVLPAYALAEQGSQIHAACWPGRLRAAGSAPAIWPDQHLLSRAFAVQTGTYVLCAGVSLTRDSMPEKYRAFLPGDCEGGSVIIDPRGEIISDPIDGEGLVIAECFPARIRAAKVAFDCAGHSSRLDQLGFTNYAREEPDTTMPEDEPMDTGGGIGDQSGS
jgi:predicted amidohydrolase